ncbi:hypothetical protein D9619_009263 [Psilocybe cf. subviscida]|uniref:Peptidase C14 caspase domain-containing protein n=1 Tax=Psilocybe cf. subviscida TaxID=2480587 RepID=A0A8H5FAE7_9AGAR|nr:hypothetical protein D9619_009263 [Psilocybe cf. subviscida]
MTGSILVPMASQPTRSEKWIRVIIVVLRAIKRFKSNRRTRRALLIGISYQHHDNKDYRLIGPVNDVRMLRRALVEKFGFRRSEIILLVDRKQGGIYSPTRENIIREIKRLMSSRDENVDYVFSYSGYCMEFEGPHKIEHHRLAPALVPVDALTTTGDLVEDMALFDVELKKLLVDSLGPKSRLFAIIDASSSATVILGIIDVIKPRVLQQKASILSLYFTQPRNLGRQYISEPLGISVIPKVYRPKSLVHHTSQGGESVGEVSLDVCTGFCSVSEEEESRVVCLSACKDSENVFENWVGQSLIHSIVKLWEANADPTYRELANAMRTDTQVVLRNDIRKDYRRFLRRTGSPLGTEILQKNPISQWIASRNYAKRWNMQISTPYPLDVNKRFTLCGSAAR